MTERRGRFITLEGGEGTGKSTQARLLAERLRDTGIDCVVTREPGGTPTAERLRDALLSGLVEDLGGDAEALVFSAARIDHLDQLIRPALESGKWVVCDRFIDSTRVYQGELGQADPALIRALERVVVGSTTPDLTIVLDLDPDTGLERAQARRGARPADRFESETRDYHVRLRDAFLAIASREPARCVVIGADGKIDEVALKVWGMVNRRLRPLRWLAANDEAAKSA